MAPIQPMCSFSALESFTAPQTRRTAETIYKVTPAGTLTTLHTFSNSDGLGSGQLSLASDGNIYGGMNLLGPPNKDTDYGPTI